MKAVRCRLAVVMLVLALPATVQAHLYFDGSTWVHTTHGRYYAFWNGSGQQAWWDACRAAQVNWENTMGGSLHFTSAATHDLSQLHCLDGNYGPTGWYGRSITTATGYLCAHCGHAHTDMNNYYNFALPFPTDKQEVACHEIGHPVGLQHSGDATDCLVTPWVRGQSTLSFAHRDQLRNQYSATGH